VNDRGIAEIRQELETNEQKCQKLICRKMTEERESFS
jgi:hypothetical protein